MLFLLHRRNKQNRFIIRTPCNILAMFALTPFLGDNTRFFKNGRHFPNRSASRGSSFCGSSNRLVRLTVGHVSQG